MAGCPRRTFCIMTIVVFAFAALRAKNADHAAQGTKRDQKEATEAQENHALFPVWNGGKLSYIDRNGQVVFRTNFDGGRPFSGGLCVVGIKRRRWYEGRPIWEYDYGFIDANASVVIEPQFYKAYDFSEGLAVVGIVRLEGENKDWYFNRWNALIREPKYGYIDKSGEIVVETKYASASSFSSGVARVCDGSRVLYIDHSGQLVIERAFLHGGDFAEGLAPASLGDGWGYIDKAGEFVIEPQFESAREFSEGRAAVKIDGKWGFIDRDGKLAVEPGFDEVGQVSEGVACVNIEGRMAYFWAKGPAARILAYGRWGYIDKDGAFVIQPKQGLFRAERFSEGLARFAVDTKGGASPPKHGYPQLQWGYMDKNGQTAIKTRFDHAYDFSQGLAAVERWGLILPSRAKGYIDKEGNYVWKPTW